MAEADTEDHLEMCLALIYGAIHLNNEGLRSNPSKEEKRRLLKTRACLEAERADLEGILDAMADGESADVNPPTQAQVNEIARLSADVEEQRRTALTAGAALEATGAVLDLAMQVTAPA